MNKTKDMHPAWRWRDLADRVRPKPTSKITHTSRIKLAQNAFSDEASNITSIEEEVIIRNNVMIYQFLPMRRHILYDIEEIGNV